MTLDQIGEMSSMEFELWKAHYTIESLYRKESERRKGKLRFEAWAKEQIEMGD